MPGCLRIPPAILTGQAAGLAVAMALDGKQAITDICVPTLQRSWPQPR